MHYPSRLLSYWIPTDIVISSVDKHIFFANMSFNRVLHLSYEAIYISTFSLPMDQSKVYSPIKLEVGVDGYLYVATGANRSFALIYKYRTTDDQLIKNISLSFYVPAALTISPIDGNIYVATIDIGDTAVYILNSNGQPTALTMDKTAERLYVADKNEVPTDRVFVINSQIGKQLQSYIDTNIYRPAGVTFKGVELLNGIYKFSLQPDENIIFTASYRPKLTRKHEIYLVVRNNLTIMESILLRGEGGKGSLTVGNRKAGSSDIPLVLEMNEKQYKLCSDYLSTGGTSGNPVLQKIVTLRNTGNMKAVIHSISFGDAKCSGQGFSVNTCSNIEIEPNERYDLRIRFQPDYTLAEIAESLTLFTNIGSMTFPLIVRIPQRVLATCYQTIPRPVWESQMHCFCLCAISVLILCIFTMAVYEARRLFDDYLARAELRSRLSATNPKLFEFTDITAAVQDEHKIRERKESRTSTSSINTKKDVPKDEIKTKDNDTKTKRSNSSVSGNKDIIEAVVKTSQKSDGPNIASRPTSTSSKSLPQKPKRSITDSYPGKSSKQQTEVSTKPNQLKAQRSNHTEQSTVVTSSPSIPPSTNSATTVTDEETEPFVIPRPKRYLSKTKEVTTSIIPVKSASITDGIVPVQPTPSLPHISPPSSSTVIEKSSTRLDLSEQRKDQQNLSRSTDSLNDQQWQRVSSSRGLRKAATTNRREATDESQTANKTNKITSNNTENPVAVSSSATRNTYASISSQMSQSRRRRGRHLTRGTTSSTHVSNLTKRQSLQTNTLFSVHNRELAFRQLAEQLWAAGLPSSATASSLSIRSRCSSAPPSERGGDDDMTIVTWNNHCNDEQENMIDWDEPDKPDDGNSSVKRMITYTFYYFTYICTWNASIIIDFTCFARLNTPNHR
ncbi:unnamed protein product [Rotaria socialis]|uniref:Uncharacterized protein n=1 Tax=Rotaria socialis TaxID=392032 RepID=A0A818P4Y3_9BILA|nr:unnamed protein product [Rotaria socialis]